MGASEAVTDCLATATSELLAEERDNPWGGGDWHPIVGDYVRVIRERGVAHRAHPGGTSLVALSDV